MNSSAPARAAISICRNESASGSIAQERIWTTGIRNTATCALDESAISAASLILPSGGDDDGAAVLGRVADDRDDDGGDEEVGQPGVLGEGLDRADEDLGHERGHDRRDAEHDE